LLSRFDTDPAFKKLADTYISKVYLDNTYLGHSEASFPDREEATKMFLKEVENYQEYSILIPVFKLGREEVLEELSKNCGEVISTSDHRLRIRKACGLKGGEFSEHSDKTARIRTCLRQLK
uniref:DRMBL domain-containing protein n=1 Tax=Heligmosomoides polygyrus TaxID=6339 RepID=A0A183FC32_HELPZ